MASELHQFESAVASACANVPDATIDEVSNWLAERQLMGENSLFSSKATRHLLTNLARATQKEVEVRDYAAEKLYLQLIAKHVQDSGSIAASKLQTFVARGIASIFYSTCQPERFQLFNHMSAAEVFFVELDSLLLHAVSNPHVRLSTMQTLHIVYLAEALLDRFISRGGRFHIVAFDSFGALYAESPQLRLARAVLCERLRAASEDGRRFYFKSFATWTGTGKHSYAEYHARHQPEFVLLSDAECLAPSVNPEFVVAPGDATPLLGKSGVRMQRILHLLLAAIVGMRTHVVFMSRLVFKDNDILGFVVRAQSVRFVPLAKCLDLVRSAADRDIPTESTEALDLTDFVAALQAMQEKKGIKLLVRDYVTLPALADVLSEHEDMAEWVKAHIVTNVVAAQLPLTSRALPRIDSGALASYLDTFSGVAEAYLLGARDVLQIDEKFVDVIDGSLVGHVAKKLQEAKGALDGLLDEASATAVAAMWTWVSKQAGKKGLALEPVDVTAEFTVAAPTEGTSVAASGLSTTLVRDLLKRYEATMALTPVGDDSRLSEFSKLDPFQDFSHLDTPAGVREEDAKLKSVEGMTFQEKKRFKKQQSTFVAAIQKTADSMKVRPFLQSNESLSVAASASTAKLRETQAAKESHDKKPKKKAAMSAKERIRKDNRISKAIEGSQKAFQQLQNIIASFSSRGADSISSMFGRLDEFVAECAVSRVDESDSDAEQSDAKDAVMWAEIVGEAAEASFVLDNGKTGAQKVLAAIDEFVKKQEALLKKKDPKALLEEGDEDAALRLKSMFFDKFVAHLRAKALLEALRIGRRSWTAEISAAKNDGREPAKGKLVPMFQRLQLVLDHLERFKIVLKNEERLEIRECALLTGFGIEYERLIDELDNAYEQKVYQVDRTSTLERPNLGPQHTPARFQMVEMGHLLQRPISKTDDVRVPFSPDPWQVELLDIVDNNGSAVVCAPTSAGKTFISYYCMKKVLRESNDNVVVYVCPTRALVNQALSDVYGRYGQKTYDFSGMHVFGCLGGAEYVKQPFKCQVLVTLPETFEAILLSARYQAWAKKIRYVIFDEIHSIEGTGNGDVWERLLHMVRCPFVALSATLGATEPILNWLNGVQRKLALQAPDDSRDYTVHLVPRHGTKINRWSDIQKYAFLPAAPAPFNSTQVAAASDDLLAVHPMSAVTIEMLREGFPEDLPFVPAEALHVYDVLVQVFSAHLKPVKSAATSWLKDQLKRLKPEKFFDSLRFMTQTQARSYESELKDVLREVGNLSKGLNKHDEDEDVVNEVRKASTHALMELLGKYEDQVKKAEAQVSFCASSRDAIIAHPDTKRYVQQNMTNLLCVLKSRNLLPTLVFSFEESDCQQLVEHVVTQLEDAESAYRQTKKFKEYTENMERKRVEQEAIMERMRKGVGKVRERDEDGNVSVRQDEIQTIDEVKDFTIPDVLPEFSFRSAFECLAADEMKDIAYDLKNGDELVYRAFQRGIGMHTPDMSGKCRVHIERLFRLKYLPVVFATEGLALGVHSPCRSVVLAGDHVHLNTSQFRQMTGRAGRRGLDFLGHAVFLGVSQSKMQRLLTSHLATLKGHVHIDPIVDLRVQQMYDYIADREETPVDKPAVINQVDCLFARPLFYQGLTASADYANFQVRHFAATLGLFGRMGLVHKTKPSSLGCLVTRVMNTFKEAKSGVGAIVFATLLQRGFFHGLSDAWQAGGETRVSVFEHVLRTMCYLFTLDKDNGVPLEIHRSVLNDPTIFAPSYPDLAPWAPHDVVLPGLRTLARKELVQAINEISAVVVARYVEMLRGYAEAQQLEPDVALPFAQKQRSAGAKALGASDLAKALDAMSRKPDVRTPFVAISGAGDSFTCIEDLLYSLRKGLFVDAAHIPFFDFRDGGSRRGEQILINAVIPDFIAEGSQMVNGAPRRQHLEDYNGMRQDKSWFTLNRFMTLMDNVLRAFRNEDGMPAMLSAETPDMFFEVLQEIVLQLEQRAPEISFRFPSSKKFTEVQTQQQTQKKAKRPALAKEIRRRR